MAGLCEAELVGNHPSNPASTVGDPYSDPEPVSADHLATSHPTLHAVSPPGSLGP